MIRTLSRHRASLVACGTGTPMICTAIGPVTAKRSPPAISNTVTHQRKALISANLMTSCSQDCAPEAQQHFTITYTPHFVHERTPEVPKTLHDVLRISAAHTVRTLLHFDQISTKQQRFSARPRTQSLCTELGQRDDLIPVSKTCLPPWARSVSRDGKWQYR